MSWTFDPSTRLRVCLAVTLALVWGCESGFPSEGPNSAPIQWTSVDSLNETLPSGVQVLAGRNDTIPLRAWAVRVQNPGQTPVEVLRSDEPDGVEPVSRLVAQARACVAVNGGYYDPNTDPIRPAGLLVIAGTLNVPPTDTIRREGFAFPVARGAFGLRADGTGDVAWTTHHRDTLLQWAAPPAHTPGTVASMPPRLKARPWAVVDAVGAGPVLVAAGTTAVTTNAEVFFGSGIPGTHPRTAAGITGDGALLFVVVDGRQAASRGATLNDLARLMRDLDAVEAVNLDGGGSSTLVVQGQLVNRPEGGRQEREVATAIAVRCSTTDDAS